MKQRQHRIFFTVRIVCGLWYFIRMWEAAFSSFSFPEESESCICHDLANSGIFIVCGCVRGLFYFWPMFLKQELKLSWEWFFFLHAETPALCFFFTSKSLTILSENVASTEAVKCALFCIRARIIYNLLVETLCREAKNVDSAFSFNQTGIL